MFGWLRRPLAQKSTDYLLKDTKNNLSIADSFDTDTRRNMARDFLCTRLILDRDLPPDTKILEVSELAKFWLRSRHEALELGATSEHDVRWNNAACIEGWVGIELLYLRGMTSLAHRDIVRTMIDKYTNDNLPANEQLEVRNKFLDGLADLGP